MCRRAWHAGLKTTSYLRTPAASSIEKATAARPAAACSIEALPAGETCERCQ